VPDCGGGLDGAGPFGAGFGVGEGVLDRVGAGVDLAVLRDGGVADAPGAVADGAADEVVVVVGAGVVDVVDGGGVVASRVTAGADVDVDASTAVAVGGGGALQATATVARTAPASATAPSRAAGTDMAVEPTRRRGPPPPDVRRGSRVHTSRLEVVRCT